MVGRWWPQSISKPFMESPPFQRQSVVSIRISVTGLVSRAGNPKAHGAEVQILSANGSFNAEIFHVKIYGGHMVLCGFFGTFFGGEEVWACVRGRGGWFGVLQDEVGMG